MKFKAKLRRIGNSRGVIIPLEVITGYKLGEEIEIEVITGKQELLLKDVITNKDISDVITKEKAPVITKKIFNFKRCEKHNAYKGNCGCK